jgi:DNA modification methylase
MEKLHIQYIPIGELQFAEYNPRKISEKDLADLIQSITSFGTVDPIIVNSAPERKNIVIGGNQRLLALRKMKYTEVPVVYINIPDLQKEKELNIRLNRNQGAWDNDLLAKFDESFLSAIGFDTKELDDIFKIDPTPEIFDLEKELHKLKIETIEFQKGDVYALGDSRLMCCDSTIEVDMVKLMNGEKANMCFTDPPYILDYLNGKQRHGNPTTGFGAKKNRRYLETDVLPPDFTEKWMANMAKVQDEHFSIIVYENWKNIRIIWSEMEKHWKVKNMIVWHLPNRNQGYAARHMFFSKHDIALVGASKDTDIEFNLEREDGLQEEYETALFAISGNPHWEGYKKGSAMCPTDFIDYKAADEKSSGQGIIFGTKPIEILIPYIKVLTKRGDLIVEPFGGSGSTLIASTKMNRRCYIMEKSPVYAEVIRNRWERLTGKKAVKIA